eukprot:CAMPEP_0117758402 /NCGR_PEP_ID=MMETSP0947-20121206/15356_1 /TAXON_ID=44440 /ORGANISM="Chattonella subsalsa, Strain CCMP2191" /LENGTH=165 /DNA_ID=CAMNT_0005578581 /DNA_START=269 /DNA_END=766 /DNA_ORIENTATION=+
MSIFPALDSYLNLFVPTLKSLNLPAPLIHWFHGANMATVLFAMGGYGTYLGWNIRSGNGDGDVAMLKEETVSSLHQKLMAGMFLFFALGGQGGLVFTLVEGRDILETPHALTAAIGLSLLTVQAILAANINKSPGVRTAHAYFGTGTMVLFLAHAYFGLQLGLST